MKPQNFSNNMEKLSKNISEAIRFAGGVRKIILEVDERMGILSQNLARAADLISFYETELAEIATAKGFDNIGNWARNKAKAAIKKGEKI